MRPAPISLDLAARPGSGLAPLESDRAPVRIVANTPPVPAGVVADSPPPLVFPAARDETAFDPRNMTPREMAGRSIELYAAGLMEWDDHLALAFQPELHPDYNRTIGALLGEKAAPDAPRDFVIEWERRLLFELRYNAENTEAVGRARRILKALRKADGIVTDALA